VHGAIILARDCPGRHAIDYALFVTILRTEFG
jgi:hypothetical protein